MNKYLAVVQGEDYSFEINAENDADAHATALQHLELISMEEWVDLLSISLKE